MSRLQSLLASIVVGAAFVFASAATAEIYRYVDADGEMNVVNDIERVPAEYREAALADAAERSGGSMNVVSGSEGGMPAGAAAPAPDAPDASGATAQSITIGGHDELWWKQESRKRADHISALEVDLLAASGDEVNLSEQLYSQPGHDGGPGPDKAPGNDRGNDRGKAAVLSAANDDEADLTVDQIRGLLEQANSDYEQFQADARHAGVPPGWLR